MRSKINSMNNALLLSATLFVFFAMVGVMLKQTKISSICFILSFLFVFFSYFVNCLFEKNVSVGIISLILLVFASLTYALSEEINNINQGIITISVVLCFDMLSKIKITQKTKNTIVFIILALVLVILYLYYFQGLNKSYKGDITVSSNAITLYFNNSNEAGMWLMAIFISIFAVSFTYKNVFVKICLIIVSFTLFPIIQATKSRNSLLCCLLGIIAITFVWLFKVRKLPKWVIMMFVMMPLIVLVFYMSFVIPNQDFFERIFSSLIEEGKGIDSRNKVWLDAIENFKSWAFIGHYSEYFEKQAHNSILNNACLYGVPCTAFMFFIIYRSLVKLNDKNQAISVVAVLVMLFSGCFEMSLFAGVVGIYLFVLITPSITVVLDDKRLA